MHSLVHLFLRALLCRHCHIIDVQQPTSSAAITEVGEISAEKWKIQEYCSTGGGVPPLLFRFFLNTATATDGMNLTWSPSSRMLVSAWSMDTERLRTLQIRQNSKRLAMYKRRPPGGLADANHNRWFNPGIHSGTMRTGTSELLFYLCSVLSVCCVGLVHKRMTSQVADRMNGMHISEPSCAQTTGE